MGLKKEDFPFVVIKEAGSCLLHCDFRRLKWGDIRKRSPFSGAVPLTDARGRHGGVITAVELRERAERQYQTVSSTDQC